MTSQDYAEAFSLARRVEAARLRLSEAADQAKALRKRVATAVSASPDEARKAQLRAADRRLLEAADADDGAAPSMTSGLLPPDGLRRIGADLDALSAAIDGADAPPSPDARAGLDGAMSRLDGALTRLAAASAEAEAILAD
jgi:hypothetical protein